MNVPATQPFDQQYIVYCDESRHDACNANPYMGIGGLWIPYERKDALRRRFDSIASEHLLRGELKWSKVSEKSLAGYKAIIDAFATDPELSFRVILVDHKATDYALFHAGDHELGFYAFYYHMLTKWLLPESSYIIILDHKVNSQEGRYSVLERRLKQTAPTSTSIRKVGVANSRESRLAQLADLLTGAVTACWCDTPENTPKAYLQSHLANRLRMQNLRTPTPSPAFGKFNAFKIHLEPRRSR